MDAVRHMLENPEEILQNLIQHLGPWWDAATVLAALLGLAFCVIGVIAAANTRSLFRRRLQDGAIGFGLASFFTGIALLNLGQVLDAVSLSLFDQSSLRDLSYQPPNAQTPTGIYVQFTVLLIMLVGLFAVIRGLVLLRASSRGAASFWSGVTHLVGGVLAINIVRFGDAVARSMGTAVADLFQRVVGTA